MGKAERSVQMRVGFLPRPESFLPLIRGDVDHRDDAGGPSAGRK